MLAIAISKGEKLHQLDIAIAFLNGDLKEVVDMLIYVDAVRRKKKN